MFTCEDCLKDPRLTSKDGQHRLCGYMCGEITVKECEKLRDKWKKQQEDENNIP